MIKTNVILRNRSGQRLCESVEEGSGKYVFKGVFTALSTPEHTVVNRNNRIYEEKHFLRFLPILRNRIKENGCLLGELDHPEGRFDISLKEASHKITDIYFDPKSHCVMGKIELLDTPNGMIARQLVDAGFPIYVSSRAAGSVDENTKCVEIAEIFTYDIVCTPGFKEARLERVNESLQNFLNESVSRERKSIEDNKTRTIDNYTTLTEMETTKDIEVANESLLNSNDDITTPILEDEGIAALEPRDVSPTASKKEEKKEDINEDDEPKEDEEKKDDDSSDEKSDSDKDSEDKDEDKDDDKEKSELESKVSKDDFIEIEVIEDGEAKGEGDKDDIIDMEAITDDNEDDDSKDIDDEDKSEDDEKSDDEKDVKEKDKDIPEIPAKVTKETDKTVAKYQELIKTIKSKKDVKEAIVNEYPFAISFSPENFAKFAEHNRKEKDMVAEYLYNNNIRTIDAINEHWETPFKETAKIEEKWMQLADASDIELFNAAPVPIQESIREAANMVIIESKADAEEFWNRIGLRQTAARLLKQEEITNQQKAMVNEGYFSEDNQVPYTDEYINYFLNMKEED